MKTVTNNFKEIYGNNGPLGKKNMSPKNMLNNIVPEEEFTNNITSNYNKNMNKPVAEDIKPPFEVPYLLIFLFLLIVGIGVFIYFNYDQIKQYITDFMKPKEAEPPVKEAEKPAEEAEKPFDESEKTIKQNEKAEKEKNEKIKKGGVNELNEKINKNYTPNQIVKENGFCYIGYENGQRECTNVFDGDICMSGEIFPKLDICINPHLRP